MLRKLVNRWSTLQTAQTNASVQLESALNLDRHCLLCVLDVFITSAWNFILLVWGFYLSVMPVSRFWTKDWVRSYPFLNIDLQDECLSTLTGIMNACQLLWRKLQEGFKQVHVGVFSGTCFTLTNARISRMGLKQFQWFGTFNDPKLVQCPMILGS